MLELSYDQLETWISLFLWPFTRISGLILTAPFFSHSSIPMQVKIGFGVLLTMLVSPLLPDLPEASLMSWESVGIIIEQLLIGAAIGMVMQVVFAIVQAAGDFIGLQMGLGFATFYSSDMDSNTMILARYLYFIALLFFMAIDGHLMLIRVLVESFNIIPVAAFTLNANGFLSIVYFGSAVFSMGLMMALPVIGVLLVINLSMGILNRSAPQFTVFSVGFPISLTVGLLMFMLLMNQLGSFFTGLFEQSISFTMTLLQEGLAPGTQ